MAPEHSSFAGACADIVRANSRNIRKKFNFILKTALLRRKNRRLSCIFFKLGSKYEFKSVLRFKIATFAQKVQC
jgi:hypothetical protein